ncbi:MAG: hypothetical protein AAGA77_00375, partial [Bacteroidota bacterium]
MKTRIKISILIVLFVCSTLPIIAQEFGFLEHSNPLAKESDVFSMRINGDEIKIYDGSDSTYTDDWNSF